MNPDHLIPRFFELSFSRISTRLMKVSTLLIASCTIPGLGVADELTVEIDGVANPYPVNSYSANDRNGNVGTATVNGAAVTLSGLAWNSLMNIPLDGARSFDLTQ